MNRFLILIVALCAITGCKKDLNYNYAFNINGVTNQGDSYTAGYQYDTAASLREFAANFYIGKVTDTNYVQISFSGNNYISAEVYYTGITNPGNTLCSFAYNKSHVYYSAVSGIMQILQVDTVGHILKGNFQFTAANGVDTISVTNGSFADIKYTIQ